MTLTLADSRDIKEHNSFCYRPNQNGVSEQMINFENKTSYVILSATKLRVAVAIFARTLIPTVLKIYYIYLRKQQSVVNNLRCQFLPTITACILNNISKSLASVYRRTYQITTRRIKLKIENTHSRVEDFTDILPEKSVDCQVLYCPPGKIQADVIFIHGLHGGVDKTWKQGQWRHDGHKLKHQKPVKSQSTGNLYVPPRQYSLRRNFSSIYSKTSFYSLAKNDNEHCGARRNNCWEAIKEGKIYSNCWPRDWICEDFPGARVIALNYTTDILWCPVWKKKRKRTGLIERSDEMIEELLQLGVGRKPIVWVGHSKGGLFIKQIILNAWERHKNVPEIFNIFQQSKAIMFYSVPHKGSVLADFTLPLLRRSVELIEIQRNCDFVLDLHKRFAEIFNNGHSRAQIFSFIETSFTLMSFVYLKIVAYESADLDIGEKCDVPLDHREICKPAGRDCFLYLELIKLIKTHACNIE